ncbi:Crp/Fnr family transcriptional regulator [Aquabacterium sp. A08]|uniref:Crp/Fnr family transcriptional regulator n=1 Tax=Aquabacterium sp. A08 TaxID=2718532 RepID=UPI001AAE4BE0|nr:Crp/Fnr family transcriptional regulator [Aquabacterium sp. A08]
MPLTHALPDELRALLPDALQALAEPVALGKGQVLFAQGAPPLALFYVVHGEVVLERAGLQGQTVVLQRVRHGLIAEASMQSRRYHCAGRVTLAGLAVRLPMPALTLALQGDVAFALRWIGMLNQEVRRLRAQTERLALKGVESRLLHLIETEGDAGALDIGSGLKVLAAQLCVTHEALYRTVARLEAAGLVARGGGWLRLVRR